MQIKPQPARVCPERPKWFRRLCIRDLSLQFSILCYPQILSAGIFNSTSFMTMLTSVRAGTDQCRTLLQMPSLYHAFSLTTTFWDLSITHFLIHLMSALLNAVLSRNCKEVPILEIQPLQLMIASTDKENTISQFCQGEDRISKTHSPSSSFPCLLTNLCSRPSPLLQHSSLTFKEYCILLYRGHVLQILPQKLGIDLSYFCSLLSAITTYC